MADITLKEALSKKSKLESDLLKMIRSFQLETGMDVDSITTETTKISNNRTALLGLKVKIDL